MNNMLHQKNRKSNTRIKASFFSEDELLADMSTAHQ